jgi:hypothetical protein
MNATQIINWMCGTQTLALSPRGFVSADPQIGALCLTEAGAPIRRDSAGLTALRWEYCNAGQDFPLDQVALIALNRVVARPLRFAQVEDQLGRVVAVSYSYPSNPDPVLPVSLVALGPRFNAALRKLARHLESYNDLMTNQRRWGRKARQLVESVEVALGEVEMGRTGILTGRELAFIRYHAELSIAQPWRTR